MSKETGGAAFPQYSSSNHGVYVDGGMTLRDYFAAKAMEGFLSAPDTGWLEEEIAAQAYKMADRMLEARK